MVVHGTRRALLPAISRVGLHRMKRNHIHLASAQRVPEGTNFQVRKDSEVLIEVDLAAAMKDGFKFYVAANGVILCPGDDEGYLPHRYFRQMLAVYDASQSNQPGITQAANDANRLVVTAEVHHSADEDSMEESDSAIDSGQEESSTSAEPPSVTRSNPDQLSVETAEIEIDERSWDDWPYKVVDDDADGFMTEIHLTYDAEEQQVQTGVQQVASADVILPEVQITLCAFEDMSQRQQDCPDLKHYFDFLERNELPQDEKLARKTVFEAQDFCIEDGTLFRVTPQRDRALKQVEPLIKQMVIPTNLRQEVLYAYHDNNSHQGTDRLFAAIQPKYWWSNQFMDCKSYVKNCTVCQQAKRHYHAKKAELQPLPVVGLFERVHLDFAGPLPKTPEGYQYILLVVDSLSRFPIAIPMKTIDAKETADALFEHVWTVFGCSKQLLTDRGQTFMSKLLARLCKLMDIHRIRTGSYKPNVNSACERMNSTIWKSLRCYVESKQDSDWIKYLQCVMAAHRATPTIGTKLSPFQVLFGQRMRMPLDVALDLPDENRASTADEYIRQMLPKLEVDSQSVSG